MRFTIHSLLLLALAPPARAGVVYVSAAAPGPAHDGASWATAYLRIQDGLDAARPGDEVWVAWGAYRESLRVSRPRVGLYGSFQGNESTRAQRVVHGRTLVTAPTGGAPLVSLLPGADGVTVDGFQLNNAAMGIRCEASGTLVSNNEISQCGGYGLAGGGVYCAPGSATVIAGNNIVGNRALNGAGIHVSGAAATILDNDIRSNAAGARVGLDLDYTQPARGGGVCADASATVVLRGNTVAKNTAREGAGIWIDRATADITANTVTLNAAQWQASEDWRVDGPPLASRGGGIGLEGASATVRENVVTYNTLYAQAPLSTGVAAGAFGGGVWVSGGAVTMTNNTVAWNAASATGAAGATWGNRYITIADGGGVFASGQAVTLANNIVAGNQVAVPVGYGYPGDPTLSGYPLGLVTCNLFWPAGGSGWPGRNGNIAADPLLDAQARPQAGSPAIDRGEVSFLAPDETDRDGGSRVRGARVDIGAFEVTTPEAPPRVYVSPAGDDANAGTSWAAAKRTVAAALFAAAVDGEVWAAAGTYPEHDIFFHGRVTLLGGFQGIETTAGQRSPRACQSVLDAGRKGRVLEIPAGAERVTVDGFTIQNGGATASHVTEGAGILCSGTDIRLSNNVIRNNAVAFNADDPVGYGGGLRMNGGSLTLTNNVFSNNRVALGQTNTYPTFGSLTVAGGGGAYLQDGRVSVANNLFVDNLTTAGGLPSRYAISGGGLEAARVTGLLTGNTFVHNRATLEGPYIPNPGDQPGGALALVVAGPGCVVSNNIVAFNGSGVWFKTIPAEGGHNNVFGNTREDYFGIEDPTGANGNISADPLFVDAGTGDFRLSPASPCRDAGDNAAVFGPLDLAGNPRVQGGMVDIGAYEFVAPGALTMADAARALRLAAGLATATPEDLARLHAAAPVTLAAAAAIARMAAGLAPNP